jgi:SAM-dependent methyltransferase
VTRNINDLLIYDYVARKVAGLSSLRVLDVGCGAAPYRALYGPAALTVVFTDFSQAPTRATRSLRPYVASDAQRLPFLDKTFDLVLATEVLEHLPNPEAAAREITRVLRPGGRAIVTVPFLYPLHEIPSDFYRFTPWALVNLFCTGGSVIEIVPRGGLGAVILDLLATIFHFVAEVFLRSLHIKKRLRQRTGVLAWLYYQFWRRRAFRVRFEAKRRPPIVPTALERHTLGYLLLVEK